MKEPPIEEIMLYDVQRIMLCIHHRAWSSIPTYTKHLTLLAMLRAIKEERESYGMPIIKADYPSDQ